MTQLASLLLDTQSHPSLPTLPDLSTSSHLPIPQTHTPQSYQHILMHAMLHVFTEMLDETPSHVVTQFLSRSFHEIIKPFVFCRDNHIKLSDSLHFQEKPKIVTLEALNWESKQMELSAFLRPILRLSAIPSLQFLEILDSERESIQMLNGFIAIGKRISNRDQPEMTVHEYFAKDRERESPVKMLLVSSPLILPKPKSRHNLHIQSTSDYQTWVQLQDDYVKRVVQAVLATRAQYLICQWDVHQGIIDALESHGCNVIKYMTGNLLQEIATSSNATICFRVEDLKDGTVCGTLQRIVPLWMRARDKVQQQGSTDFGLLFERCMGKDTQQNTASSVTTIVVHSSDPFTTQHLKRMLLDKLHTLHTIIHKDQGCALRGLGAFEIVLYRRLQQYANKNQCKLTHKLSEAFLAVLRWIAVQEGDAEEAEANEWVSRVVNEENGVTQESVLDTQSIPTLESPSVKWNLLSRAMETVCSVLKIDQVIEIDDCVEV